MAGEWAAIIRPDEAESISRLDKASNVARRQVRIFRRLDGAAFPRNERMACQFAENPCIAAVSFLRNWSPAGYFDRRHGS